MEQTMTILLKAIFSIDTDGQSVLFTFRGLAPFGTEPTDVIDVTPMTAPVPLPSSVPSPTNGKPVNGKPVKKAAKLTVKPTPKAKKPIVRRVWTDSDDATLISLYNRSTSPDLVADVLGRSVSSVQNRAHHLRQSGIVVKNLRGQRR